MTDMYMKKLIDTLLIFAVIIPFILLLWPFAMWNDVMSVILRIIPSFAVQVLLFRVGKWNIIRVLPVLVTCTLAGWGIYLYFTSPHWSNATFWGSLIADYASPFIACLVAWAVCFIARKKK